MNDETIHLYAEELGQTMINILCEEHSAETVDAFVEMLIAATLPGTSARKSQTEAWAALNRRLMASIKTALPAPTPVSPVVTTGATSYAEAAE